MTNEERLANNEERLADNFMNEVSDLIEDTMIRYIDQGMEWREVLEQLVVRMIGQVVFELPLDEKRQVLERIIEQALDYTEWLEHVGLPFFCTDPGVFN
jgi:hypothetical protein